MVAAPKRHRLLVAAASFSAVSMFANPLTIALLEIGLPKVGAIMILPLIEIARRPRLAAAVALASS